MRYILAALLTLAPLASHAADLWRLTISGPAYLPSNPPTTILGFQNETAVIWWDPSAVNHQQFLFGETWTLPAVESFSGIFNRGQQQTSIVIDRGTGMTIVTAGEEQWEGIAVFDPFLNPAPVSIPNALGSSSTNHSGFSEFQWAGAPNGSCCSLGAVGSFPLSATVEGPFAATVPEPATLLLIGAGLVGMVATRRRNMASAH